MENLNWQIILSNIREAREELQELENLINSSEQPVEIELELSLRHAYHHMNSAWNIRNIETEKYTNITEAEFKAWGTFPLGFDSLEILEKDK